LAEAGISPEEFANADRLSELDVEAPTDAATRVGEALGECDFAVLLASAMTGEFEEVADTQLPAEAITCLEANLGGQAVTDALTTFFLDGSPEDLRTAISDAIVACPEAPTAFILGQSLADATPETEACVLDFVSDNPDLAKAWFQQDADAALEFADQLAGACPDAFGPSLGTGAPHHDDHE
jgi:hypothetical protein